MKASVHISTETIKVIIYTKLGHHINIKNYFTYPLPEECVLNGVILDGTPIIEGLRSLKNDHSSLLKEVSLVIDGSFVYAKKITVPGRLNKIMYDEVIRDEFAEVSQDPGNLICDYFHLGNNNDGSKDILACAVENIHAQAYLAVFKEADIKLSSVHLGIITVLQFVENNPELKKAPFVLNIIDDLVMLSMIFQNGVNVFQSRTRLYGDNRSALVQSTLDNLSGIIQFNKSQNFSDLTNCYYLGLSDSDMDLIDYGSSHQEINFNLLNLFKDAKGTEILPPNVHFAFLNTLLPDTQDDLITNAKMLEKAKARKRPKNRWLPVLIGTAALLTIAITVLRFMVSGVENEIRDLKAYLNDPETVSQRTEIESLISETLQLNTLYEAATTLRDETNSRPQLSKKLLDVIVIKGTGTVTVSGMNFSSDDGILSVTGSSMSERDAAAYVEALKTDSLIYDVYYTGYNTGSSGEFIFTIDVIASDWKEEVSS